MKKCSKCKETKSLFEFHFKNKSLNIYKTECKSCISSYHKNRRLLIPSISEKEKEYKDINKDIQKQQKKEWQKNNPDKIKLYRTNSNLKKGITPKKIGYDRLENRCKKFGISKDDYFTMKTNQNNKCLICNKEQEVKDLAIDHCHTTNKVRGLLCNSCNLGLGCFKDNLEILKNAIKYLEMG